MRFAVLLALLANGCKEPLDFPPTGPGNPGNPSGMNDGGTDAVDAPTDANLTAGRVCLVKDLRKLSTCEDTGAGDIEVHIGNKVAATEDDGTFVIDLPSGTGLQWELINPEFMTTLAQLSSSFVIPIIRADDYADLLGDNGIILDPTQGSVVVSVLDNNAPLAGATAVAAPLAQFATRYDGTSAITWDQDSTSTAGIAWLAGMSGATAQITVTPPSGTPQTTTVPVQSSTITFATVAF